MTEQDFETFVTKVNKLKASGNYDLSMEEDLSIAIMNLVSIEEHLFFTGQKTKRTEYYDSMHEAREIRKELLARLIPVNEGETWCVSKHLLATTMRLIEVGTKLRASGKTDQANLTFDQAYRLFTTFWGIRLKLIDVGEATKDKEAKPEPMTYEGIMDQLVDCCKE